VVPLGRVGVEGLRSVCSGAAVGLGIVVAYCRAGRDWFIVEVNMNRPCLITFST